MRPSPHSRPAASTAPAAHASTGRALCGRGLPPDARRARSPAVHAPAAPRLPSTDEGRPIHIFVAHTRQQTPSLFRPRRGALQRSTAVYSVLKRAKAFYDGSPGQRVSQVLPGIAIDACWTPQHLPRASVTRVPAFGALKGQSSPSRPQEDRQISPSARFRRRMEETNIGSQGAERRKRISAHKATIRQMHCAPGLGTCGPPQGDPGGPLWAQKGRYESDLPQNNSCGPPRVGLWYKKCRWCDEGSAPYTIVCLPTCIPRHLRGAAPRHLGQPPRDFGGVGGGACGGGGGGGG
eukprot:gene22154-biopygen23698